MNENPNERTNERKYAVKVNPIKINGTRLLLLLLLGERAFLWGFCSLCARKDYLSLSLSLSPQNDRQPTSYGSYLVEFG